MSKRRDKADTGAAKWTERASEQDPRVAAVEQCLTGLVQELFPTDDRVPDSEISFSYKPGTGGARAQFSVEFLLDVSPEFSSPLRDRTQELDRKLQERFAGDGLSVNSSSAQHSRGKGGGECTKYSYTVWGGLDRVAALAGWKASEQAQGAG